MTTNHVQQMKPGDGLYAFFLNAQGRILADVYLLCFEDHFLLDTEPETRKAVLEHLDHYIIADDVTLEDMTDETFSFGIEGPKATEVAAQAGMPAPHHRFAHLDSSGCTVAALSATGVYGVRITGRQPQGRIRGPYRRCGCDRRIGGGCGNGANRKLRPKIWLRYYGAHTAAGNAADACAALQKRDVTSARRSWSASGRAAT